MEIPLFAMNVVVELFWIALLNDEVVELCSLFVLLQELPPSLVLLL